MKSVLSLAILLVFLNPLSLSAEEPPEAPPAETPRAFQLNPNLIRNFRSIRRLPADALRTREAAPAAVAAEAPAAAPVDLAGDWLLTLPAGYQYRVSIDSLGENRFRLKNAVAFSGVYQLNGDVLQIVEPSDERLNVFDWQLHNVNSMTLVDETGASGARYVGATMGRQVRSEEEELPRRISAIGRPAVPRPASQRPAVVARQMTLTGTAFNDESYGPYLETDDAVVFLSGLEAWPEEVLGQSVTVTGAISRFIIQDQGESLTAQRMEVESWTRAEAVDSVGEDK